MVKKDEVSELLNEFLNTDIDFTKLKVNDINKLYDIFNNPENIIRILIDKLGIDGFIETSNTVIKKKIVESKPIRNILKNLLLKE